MSFITNLVQGAKHIAGGVTGGIAKSTGVMVNETAAGVSKAVGVAVDAPASGFEALVTPLVAHVATTGATAVGTALLVKRMGMSTSDAVTLGTLVGGVAGQVAHLYFHHQLGAIFGKTAPAAAA
jgi:hypothetical protein